MDNRTTDPFVQGQLPTATPQTSPSTAIRGINPSLSQFFSMIKVPLHSLHQLPVGPCEQPVLQAQVPAQGIFEKAASWCSFRRLSMYSMLGISGAYRSIWTW